MKLGGKKKMKAAEVDPCAVCRRRAIRNLIRCTVCGDWVHKMFKSERKFSQW